MRCAARRTPFQRSHLSPRAPRTWACRKTKEIPHPPAPTRAKNRMETFFLGHVYGFISIFIHLHCGHQSSPPIAWCGCWPHESARKRLNYFLFAVARSIFRIYLCFIFLLHCSFFFKAKASFFTFYTFQRVIILAHKKNYSG